VALGAFPAGMLREVHLEGTPVLLARVAERVHALGAVCTHAGGILADGTLTATRLTCPIHRAAFNVVDGQVLADPGGIEPPRGRIPALPRYPTRVVDGMIEVELPDA
jgi:nitrite reductase/ring-hydroxylating ferredoxin subunit